MNKMKQDATCSDAVGKLNNPVSEFLEDAGLAPMQWLSTGWLDTMADLNSEIAGFVAERIKEDVATQHAMLHCKTPQEFQKAQLDYLHKMHQQYTVEAGRFMELSMAMWPFSAKRNHATPV